MVNNQPKSLDGHDRKREAALLEAAAQVSAAQSVRDGTFMKRVRRRTFLKQLGAVGPAVGLLSMGKAKALGQKNFIRAQIQEKTGHELQADLVIIGAGLGGCAAALAAARNGLRVIMTEETDWIGGQLTAQAVPPDENPWIETFGGTRSYLELRRRIRDYYRRNFPLTAESRNSQELNPGNGWVSRLCHEPRVALAALYESLAPFIANQSVRVLLRCKLVRAETDHDLVRSVLMRHVETGHDMALHADYFADATELGDLLPLTRTEYVTGAESRDVTGEPHAASKAAPDNQQAFTCCFAMDYMPGQDHRIQRPEQYSFWRDYVPALKPAWPGRLFSLEVTDPITSRAKTFAMDPEKRAGLWAYRRIADRSQFAPGHYPSDISLVNWPQNDFLLGNLYGVSEKQAARNLAAAKQLSLSWLYWLQTEAPRPDGGTGWPGLRLRADVVGTEDGLAKYPYIRESRRILAEFTVLEQHVSASIRAEGRGDSGQLRAAVFPDSVGIGSYRIDLHPTTGGDNYLDIASVPFQIPLGALIPRRVENLLPACKSLGVTHITNGCYRLHPVEWNIGEAVGVLASFCLSRKTMPRAVLKGPQLLRAFQKQLEEQGVPLSWPEHLLI